VQSIRGHKVALLPRAGTSMWRAAVLPVMMAALDFRGTCPVQPGLTATCSFDQQAVLSKWLLQIGAGVGVSLP